MSNVDFDRQLEILGYKQRSTNFSNTYLYEYNADIKRVILVLKGTESYREEDFKWYIDNLIYTYGYGNVLMVLFIESSFFSRCNIANVQHWIYDISSHKLEICEGQPNDFYGIRDIFVKFKPDKKHHRILTFNNLIIVINIVIFIIMEILGDTENALFLFQHGGKSPSTVIMGREYYRYITSMFLHSGVRHLFNNMLLLFFVGENLERQLGAVKYLFLYFGSGLIAGIVSQVYYYLCGNLYLVCIGASGAIFGVLGALIWVLIRNNGKIEELSLTRMILYCALGIGLNVEGVNVVAHIAGLIGGFLLSLLLYRRRGARFEN